MLGSFKGDAQDNKPARFYLPAYLAPNGWLGLRLDVGEIDWDEVTAFVHDSYQLIAPKRLAAQLKSTTESCCRGNALCSPHLSSCSLSPSLLGREPVERITPAA